MEEESFDKVNSLHTKISYDLRLAGDDVEDLLVKFVSLNQLQWGNFRFDEHFYSEGELFAPNVAMGNIMLSIINLPLLLIKLITLKRISIPTIPYINISSREVTDLTFRQMLTWYIEKDFTDVDSIRYKLKATA